MFTGVTPDRVKIISVEPFNSVNTNSLRGRGSHIHRIRIALRVYGSHTLRDLDTILRKNGLSSAGMRYQLLKDHGVWARRKPYKAIRFS